MSSPHAPPARTTTQRDEPRGQDAPPARAGPGAARRGARPRDRRTGSPRPVNVSAHRPAPTTSAATNRPARMPDAPAVNGPSARTTPTKRPVTIAFAPWRAKKRSTPASRGSVMPEAAAVPEQEPPAQAAPEHVAAGVAGHGRDPHDRDQDGQLHLPPAGEHAAQDDGQLAGRDQAHERARLEERQPSDERVRPGAEAVAERRRAAPRPSVTSAAPPRRRRSR